MPEFDTDTIREIALHSYRLIYRIVDDDIHVLTLHHGARVLSRHDLGSDE
ncbi:MAG: type II toxin-antitoxin system RelE/ParE family toxin [Candidatus Latescibacterota bacterium]